MIIYNVFRIAAPKYDQPVECRSFDSLDKAQNKLKEIADNQKGFIAPQYHHRIILENNRLTVDNETTWFIQECEVL